MFKSIFSKYITTMSLIIVASFLILATLISAVIGDYTKDMRHDDVRHMATLASEIFLHEYPGEKVISLKVWADSHGYFHTAANSIVEADDGATLFIADKNGHLLVAAKGNEEAAALLIANTAYWRAVVKTVSFGGTYSANEKIAELGPDNYFVHAEPLIDKNGNYLGCTYAAVSVRSAEQITSVATQTVVMSCLWITIAMLIAVYFITERHVNPIRRMNRAARKYAKGNFEDRVEAVGGDEIAELAASINYMANELENLEQKRNRFLSDVAHELRSPMTSMLGFVEAVADGSCPPEKQSYYLSLVAEEIKRLSRLVGDLLDVSRLEMGEKKMNFTKYDLADNAATVLFSLESRINEKELDVSFESDGDGVVSADGDAMYRVLYNLIENAVKFSTPKGRLAIDLHTEDKTVSLSIYNEGIGIPAEDLPNIFDRFYKSDKSRGIDKKGVGLGLYFVKTIIVAHGGSIRAESVEGKDCRFIVEMPHYKEP